MVYAAAASGILFWFFLDVMGDAAGLGVNEGFRGDYTHVVLALSFAVSLAALFWLEGVLGGRFPSLVVQSPSSSIMRGLTFVIAVLVALGIGFHAVGEGNIIGAKIPPAPSVLDAIGGVGGGIAYVLHKFLEGFVVGAFALLASSMSATRLGILGVIAGIPTLLGFFLGVLIAPDSTYFFALSGASVIYASFKLIPRIAEFNARYLTVVATLAGFYSMYIAGLFHA